MNKLLFLFGIIFLIIGIIPIFLYMNLLYFGYTFSEYVGYITKKIETIYAVIGFVLLNIYFLKKERLPWEKHMI